MRTATILHGEARQARRIRAAAPLLNRVKIRRVGEAATAEGTTAPGSDPFPGAASGPGSAS